MTTEIKNCFGRRFAGTRVLVTGHTGFKGSWLCLWLQELGAKVAGYSLPAPTEPSHFELLDLDIQSHISDVRDLDALKSTFESEQPSIVFHLAAQPLVRQSYQTPVDTFTSNVDGTLNVLQAARAVDSIRAIVCITSDKVYSNQESENGYCESDPLGGADPYSASKACCEILVNSYRDSFFPLQHYGKKHKTLIATARAGNVFGGGDWAADRLVPDAARAAAAGRHVELRHPGSVRPWQHVLEPLAGYILLAERLVQGDCQLPSAINFGPHREGNVSVAAIIDQMATVWPAVGWRSPSVDTGPHETNVLKLDYGLAEQALAWEPVWNWQQGIQHTAAWYQNFYDSGRIDSRADLQRYVNNSAAQGMDWACK